MTLAKAWAKAKSKTKHFYSTDMNYDRHLQSSKYFYSTGHRLDNYHVPSFMFVKNSLYDRPQFLKIRISALTFLKRLEIYFFIKYT